MASQKERPWGSATIQQVSDEIEQLLPGLRCSVCSGADFQVEAVSPDNSVEYLPYNVVSELGVDSPYYMFGVVPVTCIKCAHTLFFSFANLARKINGRAS